MELLRSGKQSRQRAGRSFGLKRILRELRINGSGRSGLAAVEVKAIRQERSELDRFQMRNRVAQRLQRRRIFNSRQREMRAELALFLRDSQGRERVVHIPNQ